MVSEFVISTFIFYYVLREALKLDFHFLLVSHVYFHFLLGSFKILGVLKFCARARPPPALICNANAKYFL